MTVTIALKTHFLRICPMRDEFFCALALAADLVRHDMPHVRDFRKTTHELTYLLSETIAAAPVECLQ